jgi:hypothetical protein
MELRWEQYVRTIGAQKPLYYDDYHPDDLFIAVMEDVEETTGSHLSTYKPGAGVVGDLLNEAWRRFLTDPLNYVQWEKLRVQELGGTSSSTAVSAGIN